MDMDGEQERAFSALLESRRASTVSRYHAETLLRQQSVGEHTYNVLQIARFLYFPWAVEHGYSPADWRDLVESILFHDVPEYQLGDPPAPVKWNFKDLKREYRRAEQLLFKHQFKVQNVETISGPMGDIQVCADSLECAMYALEEVRRGNRPLWDVADRALGYVSGLETPILLSNTNARALYEHCQEQLDRWAN